MTNLEKIKQIKEYCKQCILTEKHRTPGVWKYRHLGDVIAPAAASCVADIKQNCFSEEDAANGRFIAICSMAAKAGWKATLATINHLERCSFQDDLLESDIIESYSHLFTNPTAQ